MSYEETQQTRQDILDHLHANPLHGAVAIRNAIGVNHNRVQASLKMMTDRGEVKKIGHGLQAIYRAIAVTTISAEAVIAEMQEKRKNSGKRAEKAQMQHGKVERPGYYAQIGGGWKATSSGGQGALRQAVGVACSFGMV